MTELTQGRRTELREHLIGVFGNLALFFAITALGVGEIVIAAWMQGKL